MPAKFHIAYISMIVLLCILLVLGCIEHKQKDNIIIQETADTLTIIKTDTMRIDKVIKVSETIVRDSLIYIYDTVYITLPIKEYRFEEKGKYSLVAEGIDIKVRKLDVYPKTIYTTVTNVVERDITKNSWKFYAGIGFSGDRANIYPNMGIYITTPKKWLFGANLGYFNKNMIYSANIAYNIGFNN